MKRIHFDGKGPVYKHYFFWEPWGCIGCLGRSLLFLLLLLLLLFILSKFKSCQESSYEEAVVEEVVEPYPGPVPPINDEDIIDDEGRRIISNRLNVLFSAEVGIGGMDDWSRRFKELYPGEEYAVLFSDSLTKLMSIQVPPEQRRELKEKLPEQIPDIPFMVFEEEVMVSGASNNAPFVNDRSNPWYFNDLQIREAMNRTMGSDRVVIAVVDSYFDLNNHEFDSVKIVMPYNVADDSRDVSVPSDYNPSDPDPVLSHGTMVSALTFGIYRGPDNTGIAPRCSFMPVSLGARFGCLAMLQGILYAINKGASVINISAGLSFADDLSSLPVSRQVEFSRTRFLGQEEVWKYVFDMADKFYVTIVWAAGNENVLTTVDASKRGDNTIKVSSVGKNLQKADFSNFGNLPRYGIYESTVSAPGVEIYGALPGRNDGMAVDGTSFSAPVVAGCVGLIKSLDATLSTRAIGGILRSTGRSTGPNSTIGPLVQMKAALDSVDNTLLSFSDLKRLCSDGPFPVTIPTTLLSRISTANHVDSLALQPPVRVRFILTEPMTGNVEYYTDFDTLRTWTAPIEISYDPSGYMVNITQRDSAVTADTAFRSFSSASFYATPDQEHRASCRGCSSSLEERFNCYFKKPL